MGSIVSRLDDILAEYGTFEAYFEAMRKERISENGGVKKVVYICQHDLEQLKTDPDLPALRDG